MTLTPELIALAALTTTVTGGLASWVVRHFDRRLETSITRLDDGQSRTTVQVAALVEHVKTQNSRIDKLEAGRVQMVDREVLAEMLGRHGDQADRVAEKITELQQEMQRVGRAVFEELVPRLNEVSRLRGEDPAD